MRCAICDYLLPLNHRTDICSTCQSAVREAVAEPPSFLSDEESEVLRDIT